MSTTTPQPAPSTPAQDCPKPRHWHIKETLRTLFIVGIGGAFTGLLEMLHARHMGEPFTLTCFLDAAGSGAAIALLGMFQRKPGQKEC